MATGKNARETTPEGAQSMLSERNVERISNVLNARWTARGFLGLPRLETFEISAMAAVVISNDIMGFAPFGAEEVKDSYVEDSEFGERLVVVGVDEVGRAMLDRYLDVVTHASVEAWTIGYFGLLLILGDETGKLNADFSMADALVELARQKEGSSQSVNCSDINTMLDWASPLTGREIEVYMESCMSLVRFIREVWELWIASEHAPLKAETVSATFQRIHGNAYIEDGLVEPITFRLAESVEDERKAILRANNVHPALIASEISYSKSKADRFYQVAVQLAERSATRRANQSSMRLRDLEYVHIGKNIVSSAKSYFLTSKFGLGKTEIARRINPEVKGKYDYADDALKRWALISDHVVGRQDALEPLSLQSLESFADDLRFVMQHPPTF